MNEILIRYTPDDIENLLLEDVRNLGMKTRRIRFKYRQEEGDQPEIQEIEVFAEEGNDS